jgi:hypothetical protein
VGGPCRGDSEPPISALAHKTVALSGISRIDEARRTLKETLAEQPAFSISFARRKLDFVRDEEQSRDIWTA